MKQPSRSENDKYSASEVAESSKAFASKDRDNNGNVNTKVLTGNVFDLQDKSLEKIIEMKKREKEKNAQGINSGIKAPKDSEIEL